MENLHKNIHDKLDFFYKNNRIPHIIFHGSSGSGKKTIVYQFLDKIYDGNRHKIKNNVMFVNCSHGKGIKFIREDLKFFAKTNLQLNQGIRFKSIVLFNADSLTTDAQSALRRCIELFSYNTRFFIIVENKHKLLNPILSRFCEIYVPEYVDSNGNIENLHKYHLNTKFYTTTISEEKQKYFKQIVDSLMELDVRECLDSTNLPASRPTDMPHILLSNISLDIYDRGYSCIDLLEHITKYAPNIYKHNSNEFMMKFHSIKSEFRCEKLLILYMLDFIFVKGV